MEKDHRETYQKAVFGEPGEQIVRTDPEFVGIIADFSQSEVPKASRLTEKERQLCILSVLLGCQGLGEFRNILHTALENGLEPVAVKEVIYQAAAYLGLGRIYDFLIAANQIMEQHGILLPLPKQGTTDKKNRFSYLERQWQSARRAGLLCAGISTGGWQTTVLEIIIPVPV